MIDLNLMVQKYYYHTDMKGSNGIKKVLPAVMNASSFLKEKYFKPLTYGKWLKGMTLWEHNSETNKAKDPYSLLPPIFDDIDSNGDTYVNEKGEIRDGGAAMMAYCYLQFSDMAEKDRQDIIQGLLRYCELDTLAMLMIYEHWAYLKKYI